MDRRKRSLSPSKGEFSERSQDKKQRTGKGAGAGANDKAPCVICLQPLPVQMTRAAAVLVEDMPNCGHRFHAECVLDLQRSGVNNLCPLCRAAMPASAQSMVDDAWTLDVRAENGKVDGDTYRMLKEAVVAKLRNAVARDPQHALALNDLAYELKSLGKLTEAEPLYWRSLELEQKKCGDTPSSTVANMLYNLGRLLVNLKRYNEAEPLFKQSIQMQKKKYGEEDPRVAFALHNLAWFLQEQDHDSAEAARLGKQALAIAEKRLGPDHPRTQQFRSAWGDAPSEKKGACAVM